MAKSNARKRSRRTVHGMYSDVGIHVTMNNVSSSSGRVALAPLLQSWACQAGWHTRFVNMGDCVKKEKALIIPGMYDCETGCEDFLNC